MTRRLTTGQRILAGLCAAWLVVGALLVVTPFHAECHATEHGASNDCALCHFSNGSIDLPVTDVALELGAWILGPIVAAQNLFLTPIQFNTPPGRAPPAFFLL